jgi:glycosyltransferase involved in cell wall biosynthesis
MLAVKDTDAMLAVNGAFRPQRISGQQRYATEIAAQLAGRPGVTELSLPARATGRLAAWSWVQTGLPLAAAGRPLLSLTGRAPAVCRAHVVTVHDLFPIEHPQWYRPAYARVHAALLRHHLRHAGLIVTVSEPVAEQIRQRTGRADVVVAPNAPSEVFSAGAGAGDPPADRLVEALLRRRGCAQLGQREGFLLSVASMDPRKNLARLVRAHGRLPAPLRHAYPLLLVGGSWDLFRGGELPPAEDVAQLGYVEDGELAALYREASAVVFPSLAEGFGLPAVEAAAAGARLALSDIDVLRWTCGSDADYFDPASVESITDALVHVLTAPGDAGRAAALRERVLERFSWSASADAIYAAVRRRWAR